MLRQELDEKVFRLKLEINKAIHDLTKAFKQETGLSPFLTIERNELRGDDGINVLVNNVVKVTVKIEA